MLIWCGRSDKSFRAVFKAAGLVVLRQELQKGFPAGSFSLSWHSSVSRGMTADVIWCRAAPGVYLRVEMKRCCNILVVCSSSKSRCRPW